ncbi:hypothetical protein ACFE04_000825 [Oxalis oulophora]
MGKSGGKKKKGNSNSSNQVSVDHPIIPNSVPPPNAKAKPNGTVNFNNDVFLKRAYELKEEGNVMFNNKDYVAALQRYDHALKLIHKKNPERAVFHNNRAACLMQIKPINYDLVIAECTMALEVQPGYGKALLRRARCFEALGKFEIALQDVQLVLDADPKHQDALEISHRLKKVFVPRQEESRPSPAALGASAVRGAPITGLGPCLPARPVPKKVTVASGIGNNKTEKPQVNIATANGPESKTEFPKVALKPSNGSSKVTAFSNKECDHALSSSASLPKRGPVLEAVTRWRPLKLVYDHDIRLAQMPVNCNFKLLREIVSKRFPSSKAVLMKYKDADGDLVTITCTSELRAAEAYMDSLVEKKLETDKSDSLGMLRLHVVEVSPEQEPPILEEEEEKLPEIEESKADESASHSSSLNESVLEAADNEIDKGETEKDASKEKLVVPEDSESKEVEMDDWLFEFAQLFRTHVGIDPDAHIDLHELGMELCSEALEETVTSEEAQILFDKAAAKFQEVAALAFFNWGNVHMCAARKRIPSDESAGKDVMAVQLQAAYDWVKEKYSLARQKYEEALSIKPDFYEGLLALGQQQFEMAKLHWSFALAKKIDLSSWDATETLQLFDSAEEKMKAATEMWEKLEEQRANELKNPDPSKKEELLKRKKKPGSGNEADPEISPEEVAEQAAVMRSQIHLFWGNMLFERSQVQCKLGMAGWKEHLDTAVERFKLAGASENDISMVVKNHCSNADAAAEGDAKKDPKSGEGEKNAEAIQA